MITLYSEKIRQVTIKHTGILRSQKESHEIKHLLNKISFHVYYLIALLGKAILEGIHQSCTITRAHINVIQ